MKVNELIKILKDCDPNAEVVLATQPRYPFEYAVDGLVVREEMADGDEEETWGDGCHGNDVLLLEGKQLRYGDREAWKHARNV
jgi:hypothetical protein